MICFLGTSHAARHLLWAAVQRKITVTDHPLKADVIFVSEDTPTDEFGNRDLKPIMELIEVAKAAEKPIVLTSQVPPGFTRSLGILNIFHQAETLRIKDSEYRALNPEYIAIGGDGKIPEAYADYLAAFECPILRMTWEEAEMSKIAVNMFLAAQVDITNRLAAASERFGARWESVARALKHDKRIGQWAYLTPGRWETSKHLLRDAITLKQMEL